MGRDSARRPDSARRTRTPQACRSRVDGTGPQTPHAERHPPPARVSDLRSHGVLRRAGAPSPAPHGRRATRRCRITVRACRCRWGAGVPGRIPLEAARQTRPRSRDRSRSKSAWGDEVGPRASADLTAEVSAPVRADREPPRHAHTPPLLRHRLRVLSRAAAPSPASRDCLDATIVPWAEPSFRSKAATMPPCRSGSSLPSRSSRSRLSPDSCSWHARRRHRRNGRTRPTPLLGSPARGRRLRSRPRPRPSSHRPQSIHMLQSRKPRRQRPRRRQQPRPRRRRCISRAMSRARRCFSITRS